MFSSFPLHLLPHWLRTSVAANATKQVKLTRGDQVYKRVHGSDIITVRSSKKGCPCSFLSLNGFGRVSYILKLQPCLHSTYKSLCVYFFFI